MDTCHSLRLFVLSQRIVSIHTAGVSSFKEEMNYDEANPSKPVFTGTFGRAN